MIIGIDETGTFDLSQKTYNLFVGVHFLDSNHLAQANKLFDLYKNKLGFKSGHEIKGSTMSIEMTEKFAQEVICPIEKIYINFLGTIPSKHKKKDVQYHRDHHVSNLTSGINEMIGVGNFSGAQQLTEARNWYRKLSYQLLLKMWLLGEMIGDAFFEHVVQAILDGTDRTLGTLKISIDRDFVKNPTHTIFWKFFLGSQFYSYTYRNPIPIIKEWPKDHPFYITKVDVMAEKHTDKERFVDKDGSFKKATNFFDSKQSIEVQIADIIATIVGGFLNNGKHEKAFNLLKDRLIPKRRHPFKLVYMSKAGTPNLHPAPNPFKAQ